MATSSPASPPRDRWEWRRRIRAHPVKRSLYRVAVGIAGTLLIVAGCISGPLPGPGGIPLVLAGLAVLASEFQWARRVLDRLRVELRRLTHWAVRQPRWIRWSGSVAGVLAATAAVWLAVVVLGTPSILPDAAHDALASLPGVRE